MRKILVLGGNGNLGNRLSNYNFKNYKVVNIEVGDIPEFNKNLDLLNLKFIEEIFRNYKPDIVLNCAAISNVEYCESNPEHAKLVNSLAPIFLASLAKKYDFKLIHISTDHFLSMEDLTRDENCDFHPSNIYGYSKLRADQQILNINKNAIIVRTNFFGYGGQNLFKWAIDQINCNKSLKGFIDVTFNPVSIDFLCKSIELAIEKQVTGIINIVGNDIISKYEFIKILSELYVGKELKIDKVYSRTFQPRAVRPLKMALDNKLMKEALFIEIPSISTMIQLEIDLYKKEKHAFLAR
jgi:dTDP-4-dehydrorhamnose reductase